MKTMSRVAQVLLALAIVSIAFGTAYAQLEISEVYTVNQARVFRPGAYEGVFTRQNSCTITLADFYFDEVKQGNYLISMKMAFQENPIGGGAPVPKYEFQTLFEDVIQDVKGKEPIKLKMFDKRLASNINLSRINNVHVEIRLTKVKDSYKEFMNLAQPILNAALPAGSGTAFQLVDKFLDQASTAKADVLLFNADFYIPANIFEYNRLAETEIPILLNNQPYAIFLEGVTTVPPDNLLAKLGAVANKATMFVNGKRALNPSQAKYTGLVRLYFTKDTNPVLPASIDSKLREVDYQVRGYAPGRDKVALAGTLQAIANLASLSQQADQIDTQTLFSINEYLKLSSIYLKSLSKEEDDKSWPEEFLQWSYEFDTRGASLGAQAVGITGIYKGQAPMAKIYLPYSLSDEQIMSFYLWQVAMHKQLANKNKFDLALPAEVQKTKPR